jgi:hypothetical protein
MPIASRAVRKWVLAVLAAGCAAWGLTAGSCSSPVRPTEEPSPSPSPSPISACGAPPGTFNENCSRDSATFDAQVDRAIEELIAERPELFDTAHARGCGRCFLVVDPDTFTRELVARLEKGGLCALYDGEELAVKASNDFNDQFDVLTFEQYLRRENGSYRGTCRPAWF